MAGKTNSATEFKINITSNDTLIWFSLALITGEMAAMALPPQMAVLFPLYFSLSRF